MRLSRLWLVLLCLCWLLPGTAAAQSRGCEVISTPVFDYGDVTSNPTIAIDRTQSLLVRCTGNGSERSAQVKVCVGLPAGTRQLASGSARLGYEIYTDANHAVAWGTRAGGTTPETFRITMNQGSQSHPYGEVSIPMYGRLAGGQPVTAGGQYTATLAGAEVTSSTNTQLSCGAISAVQGNFSIASRANVPGTCDVTAQDLNFGAHSRLLANIDATTSLSVQCTVGISYRVKLDGGTVANDVAAREMRRNGGTERIGYQLRLDAPNGALWGDGNSGTSFASGTGNGAVQGLTVYGRVPAQATTLTGHYEDTVTATVEY